MKVCVYLKGKFCLALWLSPYYDGDDGTNHGQSYENGKSPYLKATLHCHNTEHTHQHTCGRKIKYWNEWTSHSTAQTAWRMTSKYRERIALLAYTVYTILVRGCVSDLIRWCRCWRQSQRDEMVLGFLGRGRCSECRDLEIQTGSLRYCH